MKTKSLIDLQKGLKGPVFSIVTPFKGIDDNIDYNALEKYINYAYSVGARNFFLMAYNSRFSELTNDEIKELSKAVVNYVKKAGEDTIVIVADPLHCSTKTSSEFCRYAQDIGADLISLIFREKYYSDEQVFKHYEYCAKSTDIGVLIHEMPFISGHGGYTMNWPIELLERIADLPNVIAIKEDAKDDEYTQKVINTLKDRLTIILSGGGKSQWIKYADSGCQSWLNGIGVFEPKLAVEFWKAYQKNDMKKCNNIINEIDIPFFAKGVDKYGWHLMIKAALEIRGHFKRQERMPMMELPEKDMEEIRKWFNKLPIDSYI